MHPVELKKKWKLTWLELAIILGYESDYTVRSWGLKGKHKRKPQAVVFLACKLLDEKWEAAGKVILETVKDSETA